MGTVIDEKSACQLWGYLTKSVICENLKRGKISSGKRERRQLPSFRGLKSGKEKLKKLSSIELLDTAYAYKLCKIFYKIGTCTCTAAFVTQFLLIITWDGKIKVYCLWNLSIFDSVAFFMSNYSCCLN